MQTDKKNALAYDSPTYIIRSKILLLQKEGKEFFKSSQIIHYPLPIYKPNKLVHVDYKFGLSNDSPFNTRYSSVHPLTPTIFRKTEHSFADSLRTPLHNFSKGCSTKQLSPNKDGLFMRMLNHSSSREVTMKDSFI